MWQDSNTGSLVERGKLKSEVSVMGMERRGRHTQATGIIQLLNKEEDMMKEAKPFVIGIYHLNVMPMIRYVIV